MEVIYGELLFKQIMTSFYLLFYRRCVSFVSDFESSLYKECHEKILEATNDLKDCSSKCEYDSIGLAYSAIGKAREIFTIGY